MLNGIMGASPMAMAFGGMKELHKNKARTYYMQCVSRAEAESWATAIGNNIKVMYILFMY
jgi:hypothetical protein